ncbi:YoaK family protein [Streptomyces sp. NPDC044571]|uniref:YoaK family protein n=1 Tax=Streptomyces sp. NPDC044571 TaxID=3155371 RepID=UPI003411BA90
MRSTRRGLLRTLAAQLFPPGPEGAEGPHGVLPPLLVVLTFVSGLVDAVSYLAMDHVFVANMTGNVAFLGFALAGERELSISASLLALLAFLAGAAAARRLRGDRAAPRMFGPLVAVQAGLVAAALAVTTGGAGRLAVVLLLALGMGLQNAVAYRNAVPDLTTTVVTRTLTGLAVAPWGRASLRRVVSVAALFLGALTGGLLTLHRGPRWTLAVAVVLLLGVAAAAHRHRRRGGPA